MAAVRARLVQRGAWMGASAGAIIALVLLTVQWYAAPSFATSQAATTLSAGFTTGFTTALLAALAAVGLGAALGAWMGNAPASRVATTLEQQVPASRNLLFTAWERESSRERDATAVHATAVDAFVAARADALAATISVDAVVPLSRVRQVAAATIAAAVLVGVLTARSHGAGARRAVARTVAALTSTVRIDRLDVRVQPPAYTARAPFQLRDPLRVDALEGSAIELAVDAAADSVVVGHGGRDTTLRRTEGGAFRWRLTARDDGVVAVTPWRAGRSGVAQVIGIGVTRDRLPVVRIVAPTRDLVVTDTSRQLPVRLEATDDLGLAQLELHLTRVAGAGERFTFAEQVLAVAVRRDSATGWRATTTVPLDSLLKEPGDVVVYRARARDARAGAPWAESDALLVERAQSGGVAALGFSTDPDEDRYAVSQQMVILKTERLIASQRTLAPQRVADDADALAVEQRRVRAEFVFMTGGEFEQAVVSSEEGLDELDETEEAEHEADLSAGRMANRGRAALLTAIRAMSRAALALTERNLPLALRHEKTALTNLQEAFARQRFLMRALSQREALDLTRRLTGPRDSIARTPTAVPAADRDALRPQLRDVLAALPALRRALVAPARDRADAPAASASASASATASALSLQLLQADATARDAQQAAAWLAQVARAPRDAAAPARVDSVATALSGWLQRLSPLAPAPASARRALEAELSRRATGGRP